MSRNSGLDLLRACSILLVVGAHGVQRVFARSDTDLHSLVGSFSALGVHLFFGLSGFLIGGILLREVVPRPGWRALRRFWVRRWFRTLPNYYLFIGVNVLLAAWLTRYDVPVRTLLFLDNFWWPHGIFMGEAWSLAVEEWFYVLLPILLAGGVALWGRSPRSLAAAAAILIAVAWTARFALVLNPTDDWFDRMAYSVLFRLDAVGFGVLAAVWLPGRISRAKVPALAGLGLLLSGVTVFVTFGRSIAKAPFLVPVSLTYVAWSVGTLLLLPWLLQANLGGGGLLRVVQRTSLYSYSWYLVHLPLMIVLERTMVFSGPWVQGLVFVSWVGATFLLAGLIYHVYERPMMGIRDHVP